MKNAESRHQKKIKLLALAISAGLCSSAFAAQQANIPDFYQHQFWSALAPNTPANPSEDPIPGWEGNAPNFGGWCWPVAITDALYYWQVQAPYTNLDAKAVAAPADISTPGKWLPAMSKWIPDVVNNGAFKPGGINTYLNYTGLGPAAPVGQAALQSTTYTIDATTGNVMQPTAAGGMEVVKKAGNPVTGVQWYEAQVDKGASTVLNVIQTPATKTNGLWWDYHAVAGAGYTAGNQILIADPDSNLGNQAADAGWFNLTAGGGWDTSAAGINAATHRVAVNQYTQFNAAASVPLPGNPGGGFNYKTSDVYGTWNINANGFTVDTSDNLGGADKGRYAGVQMSQFSAISPRVAAIAPAAPKGGGAFTDSFDLDGELDSTIDQIEIFPLDPLSDSTFGFDQPGWTELQTITDPWGYSRPNGGEDIIDNGGSMITSATDAVATLDTLGADTAADVFMHDSITDEWFLQTIGGPDDPALNPQQEVPEPTAISIIAIGGFALLRRRRSQ